MEKDCLRMRHLLRKLLALTLALGLGMSPVLAADSPEGIWQTHDRKMDFKFTYCGDGKQLCAELVAVRGSANSSKNCAFLNKPVLNKAVPDGTNAWKGTISLLGRTANGTIKLTPGKQIRLDGCLYFVVCDKFVLFK